MTLGDYRFRQAVEEFSDTKENTEQILSGILGLNVSTVQVPNREGFVYVRLRDNMHEVIQAFNSAVSPVYGLPVLIKWDVTRYVVIGRDLERYEGWGTTSAYLPLHGASHSFSETGAGDVVWIYSRQFLPWLISPSGSNASANGLVNQGYPYFYESQWKYLGVTGTPSLVGNQPTGGASARMSLVYLDMKNNIIGVSDSTDEFDSSVTGTSDVLPYIPAVSQDYHIPLAGVRLVTGTSTIGWSNLYDLRPFFNAPPTGTAAAGGDIDLSGYSDGSVLFVESEDVQEDNANLFFDNTDNHLILGGNDATRIQTPTSKLSIQGNTVSAGQETIVAGAVIPYFAMGRANGEFAFPTAIQNGDIMYRAYSFGYDGAAYVNKARVDHIATQDWDTNARGTKIQVRTTPTGTANTEAVAEWMGTGLNLHKGIQFNDTYASGSATINLDGEDTFLWVDAAGATDITVNLPPADNDGQFVVVKPIYEVDPDSQVKVSPSGSDTIDYSGSDITIDTQYDALGFLADGLGNWQRVTEYSTSAAAGLWAESSNVLSPVTDGNGVLIDVPTASREALILRTTDDDATSNLFEAQDSSNNAFVNIASDGVVTIERTTSTENDPSLHIKHEFLGTGSSPISSVLIQNTSDAVGGDDYQNEVHLRLQAGTTANHRRYINFTGYDGSNDWLIGINASNQWIMYDAESPAHRMFMVSDGDTHINAAGSGVVRINNYSGESVGTGGLAIYDGAASPNLLHLFDAGYAHYKAGVATNTIINSDGQVSIVGSINTNYGLTVKGTYTGASGSSLGAIWAQPVYDPATISNTGLYGMNISPISDSGNAYDFSFIVGGTYTVIHAGSGLASTVMGMQLVARTTDGAVSTLTGANITLQNQGGNVVSTGYGLVVHSATNTGGGSITTNYGIRVMDQTAGGTNIAIRLGVTSGANRWNVYNSGDANNWFAGKTSFAGALTTPGARVHIKGSDDDQQLIVQAHSTQTTNLTEWQDSAGNIQVLFTGDGGAVFNEEGNNADFRIESQNYDAFLIDADDDAAVLMNNSSGKIGFYGATPVVRPAAYTPTNVSTDRSFDADSTTIAELADVLGTLIADIQSLGLFQ